MFSATLPSGWQAFERLQHSIDSQLVTCVTLGGEEALSACWMISKTLCQAPKRSNGDSAACAAIAYANCVVEPIFCLPRHCPRRLDRRVSRSTTRTSFAAFDRR